MAERKYHFIGAWDYPIFKESSIEKSELDRMKQEIGETKEKISDCLDILIQKLNEQTNLVPCLDETFLLGHLRVSKFNTSKACDRILNYYRLLKNQSKLYDEVCESAVSKTEWFRNTVASPCRMEDNSIMIFSKPCLMDPEKMTIEELFYLDCLFMNQLAMYPAVQLSGITSVADISGMTFQKMIQYTPKRVLAYVRAFQNSFPLRFKCIHIINVNRIFYSLYRIVYPLLTKKMRNRMILHPYDEKYESLHSYIPPELLPEEYGGQLKQSQLIDLMSTTKEMSEEFRKLSKFGFTNKTRA